MVGKQAMVLLWFGANTRCYSHYFTIRLLIERDYDIEFCKTKISSVAARTQDIVLCFRKFHSVTNTSVQNINVLSCITEEVQLKRESEYGIGMCWPSSSHFWRFHAGVVGSYSTVYSKTNVMENETSESIRSGRTHDLLHQRCINHCICRQAATAKPLWASVTATMHYIVEKLWFAEVLR